MTMCSLVSTEPTRIHSPVKASPDRIFLTLVSSSLNAPWIKETLKGGQGWHAQIHYSALMVFPWLSACPTYSGARKIYNSIVNTDILIFWPLIPGFARTHHFGRSTHVDFPSTKDAREPTRESALRLTVTKSVMKICPISHI